MGKFVDHRDWDPGLNHFDDAAAQTQKQDWLRFQRQSLSLLGGAPWVFVLTDTALVLAALSASHLLMDTRDFPAVVLGVLVIVLQINAEIRRGYRIELSALEDVGGLFRRMAVAYALASGVAYVSGFRILGGLLGLAALTLPLLLAGRSLIYAVERASRRRGHRLRTLVVGSDEVAGRIMSALRSCPEFGLEVVGIVDDWDAAGAPQNGVLLGGLRDVRDVIRTHNVEAVIVSFSRQPDPQVVDLMRGTVSDGRMVWVVPRFFEFGAQVDYPEKVWGLPLVALLPPGPLRPSWPLKRAFDITVSGLFLLLFSPVMILIAAGIVLESGRPVLFKQRRAGAGRAFDILKFRTMIRSTSEVSATEWVPDTARTTKFGKFLRSSGLDELPQLFNVLKGEMSLVGPRPERPFFIEQFQGLYPRYGARHRVSGGITGYSQIRGLRGDTSVQHRAAADNYYIDTWSFGTDLKIILRSVPCLIAGPEILHPSDFEELLSIAQPLGPTPGSSGDSIGMAEGSSIVRLGSVEPPSELEGRVDLGEEESISGAGGDRTATGANLQERRRDSLGGGA